MKHPFPLSALVTDDTQMSLYALRAIRTKLAFEPETLEDLHLDEQRRNSVRVMFADAFVNFAEDPDNNRAPGLTCMNALAAYKQYRRLARYDGTELTGAEGIVMESKGCGANMRSGWLGLLPLSEDAIINLSVLQTETTHGHPLALASSVLTALTVRAIISGEIKPHNGEYFEWALSKTQELQTRFIVTPVNASGDWNPNYGKGLVLLSEFLLSKKGVISRFKEAPVSEDICSFFGQGWVAEEAYLCALMAADYSPIDPLQGVERLVRSNGDSDSIAAIGGQFIGAFEGFSTFPADWETRLESRYQDELKGMLGFLIGLHLGQES